MINNSNYQRWDRLNTKNLDQQFTKEVIHGLNCSPFEASAVLETVYRVYGDFFDASENLKPGQIKLSVVSIGAQNGQRFSLLKMVVLCY